MAVLEQSQELCPGIRQNTEYWDLAVRGGIYFGTQARAGVSFRVYLGPHKGKAVDGDVDGITHPVCCTDRKHTLKRVDRLAVA